VSWLRKATVAVGATLLAGCNMVVADEPMLARGPETPVMKPGVWVDAGKPDCEYDKASPVETWPQCASPLIIRADGAWLDYNKDSGKWRAEDVVLGTDDPTVVQVALPLDLPLADANPPKFIFLAMRPTEHDDAGRISAMETWMMQCGPLDKGKSDKLDAEAMATKAPFKGLTMVDGNCHADGIPALVNAARESEALADKKGAAHWLMDAPEVEVE
jgi:hypothetical protein